MALSELRRVKLFPRPEGCSAVGVSSVASTQSVVGPFTTLLSGALGETTTSRCQCYIPVSMRMRQRPPFGDVAAGRTASCLFDRGTLWGTAVVVVAAVACLNGFRRRRRRHHRCGRRPPASASSSRD